MTLDTAAPLPPVPPLDMEQAKRVDMAELWRVPALAIAAARCDDVAELNRLLERVEVIRKRHNPVGVLAGTARGTRTVLLADRAKVLARLGRG
jgi:hypothetical protein